MRFLSLVFLICSACDLNAQCPILLRQASVEAHGKEVTIRYYNSDARVVQAVEFVETRGGSGTGSQDILTYYSTRERVNMKREATAMFRRPVKNFDVTEAPAQPVDVQVTRVVFIDRSTWKSGPDNTCRVVFTPH